jgi:tetratricopeptide (TPR) repeat protein
MKTALLLVAALLALPLAQDPGPAAIDVKRTDGETMIGTVLSLQDGKVKMRVSILGGSMVVTHRLTDFDPPSAFRIELAANPPKDFDGHFAMAKRAAELGLRTRAGAQARAAVAATKGLPDAEAKQNQVRAWGADALEKMAMAAVTAGDRFEARRCLELLTTRLPDQRTEQQLETIASAVEGLEQKVKQDEADRRQKRLDDKQRAQIQRQLKPIEDHVAKGMKTYGEAVRKTSTTASANLCETAVQHFRKAYDALAGLVDKNPDDELLASAATTIGKEIHDYGIRAALHGAQMLCTQSDYKQAMEWTQKVLAFDPGNADAKAMVNTITLAAADSGDDWRWGWTIGDIGRVGDGPRPSPHR